ncbi:MAG TPA: S-layer homology domain-containing protein, partial [Bacillota bacterium]|nr:S-layer homology domain-containing protein [Bacillota bacterium]
MRKVLSFMLVLAMILGSFSMVFALEFPDVDPDAKYHDAVAVLSDLDVVSGYTDGNYKPDNVVTRAEMASLIIKALGIAPAASATTRFPDVPSTHWASGYIA